MTRKAIILLCILLNCISCKAFASGVSNNCQIKVLSEVRSGFSNIHNKQVVDSSILGLLTVRYQVICDDDKNHKILISNNQYANKENTMYFYDNKNFSLSLIPNKHSEINSSGYYINSSVKNEILSNKFDVISNVSNINEKISDSKIINFIQNPMSWHSNTIWWLIPWVLKEQGSKNIKCHISMPNNVSFGIVNPSNLSLYDKKFKVILSCVANGHNLGTMSNPSYFSNLIRVKFIGDTVNKYSNALKTTNDNLGIKLSLNVSHLSSKTAKLENHP